MPKSTISKYVLDRIAKSQGRLAVFYIDGHIRTMDPNSERFDRMLADYRQCFCGVYDSRAKLEWIEQDIESLPNFGRGAQQAA